MLNSYFDHIYLINLSRRVDRLERVTAECNKYGIKFERFEAVDGHTFDDYVKYDEETSREMRWSYGAAALVKTTQLILEDAMNKKYKNILILEDDVEFHPLLNEILETNMHNLPADWETFYLGLIHRKPFEIIYDNISRVQSAYCCHCYAINNTMYEYMHELISDIRKPIDHYTADEIQARGKSYCFFPNLAYQRADYSDIGLESVSQNNLRNQIVYVK